MSNLICVHWTISIHNQLWLNSLATKNRHSTLVKNQDWYQGVFEEPNEKADQLIFKKLN